MLLNIVSVWNWNDSFALCNLPLHMQSAVSYYMCFKLFIKPDIFGVSAFLVIST